MRDLPWYWYAVIGLGVAAPIGLLIWMAADDSEDDDDIGTDFDAPPLPTYPNARRRITESRAEEE